MAFDHGPLRALALDINLQVHGVPVTVIRPSETPIETRGIWLAPDTLTAPAGFEAATRDEGHVLVLSRADVPQVPRGTTVTAPAVSGGGVRTWRLMGVEHITVDQWRVRLVLDGDAENGA